MPPPADTVSTRLFLGPALRTQPDRRLVTLVREGYEVAFEEIVRRYGAALGRYAAAIVGSRSEDVTQDAFSKALLALRRDNADIELRPWLYRIVRNTALNDLRDRPPSYEALAESVGGERSAAEEAVRREEVAELLTRLRALPEPQRAAIVMRELEGLSHTEIAAALGTTGGGARQAIHRARVTLRNGLGMLIPLPLLRLLIDHGAEAAGAGGAAIATGAATAGGAGAGGALKVGAVAALVAGSLGAGVALRHDRANSSKSGGDVATSPLSAPREAGVSTPQTLPATPLQITAGAAHESSADGHRGGGRRAGEGPTGEARTESAQEAGRGGEDAPAQAALPAQPGGGRHGQGSGRGGPGGGPPEGGSGHSGPGGRPPSQVAGGSHGGRPEGEDGSRGEAPQDSPPSPEGAIQENAPEVEHGSGGGGHGSSSGEGSGPGGAEGDGEEPEAHQ